MKMTDQRPSGRLIREHIKDLRILGSEARREHVFDTRRGCVDLVSAALCITLRPIFTVYLECHRQLCIDITGGESPVGAFRLSDQSNENKVPLLSTWFPPDFM